MPATRRSKAARRAVALFFAGFAIAAVAPATPASAENLFQSLFGGMRSPRADAPSQASSYADPAHDMLRSAERRPAVAHSSGGGGPAFCVRLCDGRFFPMQRHAGASPAELCQSFCPASKTMVFHGGKIDYARAPNGQRYADLDNAYVYRTRVISDCTCNGKDGLGLARVNATTDPTLRQGDIVATNGGFATFRGRSGTDGKTAEFTPIKGTVGELSRRLAETKVTPAPQQVEVPAVDNTPPQRNRSAQLAR